MMTIRRAAERGHFENSWLNANHSFSFGEYYDPQNMGYSNLRVLNDDTIAPKGGFPTHPHDNMEIVTYVLSGVLEHKDSMGNGSIIRPGDVQRMSAGTGVRHSEFNPSPDEPVSLLQIWLRPNRLGIEPEYSQQHFPAQEKRGRLRLIVSPDGRDGSIATYQDSLVFASILEEGEEVEIGRRAEGKVGGDTMTGRYEAPGIDGYRIIVDHIHPYIVQAIDRHRQKLTNGG